MHTILLFTRHDRRHRIPEHAGGQIAHFASYFIGGKLFTDPFYSGLTQLYQIDLKEERVKSI